MQMKEVLICHVPQTVCVLQVISCGEDRSLCLWDLAENTVVQTWQGHNKSATRISYAASTGIVVSVHAGLTMHQVHKDGVIKHRRVVKMSGYATAYRAHSGRLDSCADPGRPTASQPLEYDMQPAQASW